MPANRLRPDFSSCARIARNVSAIPLRADRIAPRDASAIGRIGGENLTKCSLTSLGPAASGNVIFSLE
jgi:hypothetical protein